MAGICTAYELLRCGIKATIFEASDQLGGRMMTLPFAPDDATASCPYPPVAEMGAMRFSPMMATFEMYASRLGIEWGGDFPNPLTVPTILAFPGFKQFIVPPKEGQEGGGVCGGDGAPGGALESQEAAHERE